MSEQTRPNQICPYLGLTGDRASRFSYPETGHRCFATNPETIIPLEYQSDFCFSQKHLTCLRFVDPSANQLSDFPSTRPASQPQTQQPTIFSPGRIILWGLAVLLAISTMVYYVNFFIQPSPTEEAATQVAVEPTAIPVLVSTKSVSSVVDGDDRRKATPAAISFLPPPAATPTPVPDGQIYTLSPSAADIGWVTSGEDRGNHFGDSYLYTGIFEGQVYHGAFQIDLSAVPRGAPIHYASLQLAGLRDDRLGEGGVWTLRLLAPEIDEDWRRQDYQGLFNAPMLYTLNPILGSQDLAVGKSNIFELSPVQIRLLEERIIDSENPAVSFRLDGPLVGPDNLFAWDTGYGPESLENKVVLLLNVGPSPATPPPYDYIVVTSTPTPENVLTAAAVALEITVDIAQFGTTTPPPPNVVTATPIPDELIITATPTPENEATAQTLAALATAYAITTGTPTPLPTNAVTATPTPSSTPTPTYVIITSTPTSETILEAATISAAATTEAERNGTPTPFAENWVTPIVVTSTPTPANAATAQTLAELATAQAFTTGTPTPTPGNVQTATPTPISIAVEPLASPTTTATPSPTLQPIPVSLLGKIIFLSDREGATEEERLRAAERKATPQITPQPYAFDPATGQLERLTDLWPHEVAVVRDAWSVDLRFRVFTKDAIRYKNRENLQGEVIGAIREDVPALYWYDSLYQVEEQLTHFGAGIAYGGVWSPTSEQIAFISNDSADDEIWVVNRDGSNLQQLTSSNEAYNAREIGKDTFIPEINKHPSWSPDGQQIVFFSNRTGNNQLWIMNKDGSEQRLLMEWNPYNDWDPVWVKHLDPPPLLESDQ